MDCESIAQIDILTWPEVRQQVAAVNPSLADVIDQMEPDESMKLYRAKYPYGSMLLDNGNFMLPTEQGQIKPLLDDAFPKSVRKDLGYNFSIATGILLQHSAEIFLHSDNQILPFRIIRPGHIMGLTSLLEPQRGLQQEKIWSISAGARSIFLLASISDQHYYRRLQRDFLLKTPAPKDFHQHWHLIRELANHPEFNNDWHVEMLYFSAAWFRQRDDAGWLRFQHYLLKKAWQRTYYWRNQFIWDILFSQAEMNRNLRPNPYLADTVKHLFAIAEGAVPGFQVASGNDLAPIDTLQEIFISSYRLKRYAPLFMQLTKFSWAEASDPVYYSLQLPTTMEFSPRSRRISSAMDELREIRHILEAVLTEILEGHLPVKDMPIYELAQQVDFGFGHTDLDRYAEVSLSSDLILRDKLVQRQLEQYSDRDFPESSRFFRGCVQISSLV